MSKEEFKLLWSNARWELLKSKDHFKLRKRDGTEEFIVDYEDVVYLAPLIALAREEIK